MKCGRAPGGENAEKQGICPATNDPSYDGFNQGDFAGRICWLLSGTFCEGKIQGSFAEKRDSCKSCNFYKKIHAQEGITEFTFGARRFFGMTHIGLTRKSNDDRYLIKRLNNNNVLIAVADGLGDEVAGDYAAEILRGKLAGLNDIAKNKEKQELDRLVREIDSTIYNESQSHHRLEGMGSTLVGILLHDKIAHWVHVGDSRLYLHRNKKMTQVTEDQMLSRFLLEEGEITAEQVSTHYSRHIMDQFVGCGYTEPETGSLKILPGDLLVLTTDGLHKSISENAINATLNADTDLETKARALVKASLDAGGDDNITVVIAAK